MFDHSLEKIMYFRDITVESEVDNMKSEFLSTAAHELRTPMASVFGFSELLLTQPFDEDTTREIVTTIHQQSQSLVDMLNQLLDLARIESRMGLDFNFSKQFLWPIVKRSIEDLLISDDKRKVKFSKPESEYIVDVDADKLRQVISNVLVNAYKYSPYGGDISLFFEVRKVGDSEREVGITIQDHGLGMSAEQLSHIYERFWRADTSGLIPGTGLGMALVKDIMDIHQGHVDIKSEQGVGTTVTLWLKECVDDNQGKSA
jgi:signal transduction histidine kinase